MFSLQSLEIPIIAAPMAGGVSTPGLVGAVGAAGGFGFVAGGYRTAPQLADDIALAQSARVSFGVNVFMPDDSPFSPDVEAALAVFREQLAPLAERLGTEVGQPVHDRDDWAAKIELLVTSPVPVVSFTFGVPSRDIVHRLQSEGTGVMVTVTNKQEALAATRVGVDALIVQGPEAGGHRGTFRTRDQPGTTPLLDLLAEVHQAVDVPLIGAGGISSGARVRAALDSGAWAVQLGTAFLLADEAGTHPAYRAALSGRSFGESVSSRAFTGRFARSLANAFVKQFGPLAPAAYPSVYTMTAPIRRAAEEAGDADHLALWAGTGWRETRAAPARQIVEDLWAEATSQD